MLVTTRQFLAALVVVLSLASVSFAQSESWPVDRITSPTTVEEMRGLQNQVKKISQDVMPATVGLFVGNGAGSGVIINDEGLILTAAHVIGRPGKKVKIVLWDETRVDGIALGVNHKLDSGMVKITSPIPEGAKWKGAAEGKWPFAEVGTSKDIKKGLWVVSLGHHGGARPGRTPPLRLGRFEYFNKADQTLRTDCTLVGGDSGGPLFDLQGKVIGIHSKIGMFLDFNMHVPIDVFKEEWDKLADGKTSGGPRVELGLDIDGEVDEPTIVKVPVGSSADKAGFKVGDVIIRFNGERVHSKTDLKMMMLDARPGDEARIVVKRGEETATLKLKLRPRIEESK
ncbi:MAG: S1C family serine protease [Fimbriiglobus sp.]